MVMEWWPFEDEGLAGRGSIGSLSYHRVPVTARLIQGQALVLICAMATVLCGCNGACLCVCIWVMHAGFVQNRLLFSGLTRAYIFRTQICKCSWVCADLRGKMPRASTLCVALRWQWYTVGFLRATGGGWVHRVNYTSSPLVWFIALITVGSLKKEKGEEAYKIKKKTESATVTEREREGEGELCVSACGGCWFARARHCLLL